MSPGSRPAVAQSQGGRGSVELTGSTSTFQSLDEEGCFVKEGDKERMSLIDVHLPLAENSSDPHLVPKTFPSRSDFIQYLESDSDRRSHDTRVYILSKADSWAPLPVSLGTFCKIASVENVDPNISQLIRSFKKRFVPTEEGYCCPWFRTTSLERTELFYLFRYPEWKAEAEGVPASWSIRQTGIYHSIQNVSMQSTWIMINPKPDSAGYFTLFGDLDDISKARAIFLSPVVLHARLVATYLTNWRKYLAEHEDRLQRICWKAMARPISAELKIPPDILSNTRFIETTMLPLIPIFRSYIETLRQLINVHKELKQLPSGNNGIQPTSPTDPDEVEQSLQNLAREAQQYLENTEYLKSKAGITAQLLSDILALKNQEICQDQNGNIFKLSRLSQKLNETICEMTRATVKDSATIKVITVVTLVYLPTMFVCTLFGTEFFYLSEAKSIQVSQHAWIIVAVSAPLTLLTLMYWFYRKAGYEARMERTRPEQKFDVESGKTPLEDEK